ncbi:hypothetical protein N8884_00210 [Pelagibacteraceae bacterium]|nr:hypothetical protein [Pelagibacteraceae bacterium]
MKKIIVLLSTAVFLFTSAGMSFAKTLKASHQWPGTKNAKTGKYDARHEMVQIIADEMKKANVGIDVRVYPAYKSAGVKLAYMTKADHAAWVALAKKSSFAKFVEKVPTGQKLIDQALAVK